MNVVLAVRQAHARLALELVLCEEPGLTVVGTASETEGLLALTRTAHPNLVVLEWGLPGRPAGALLADARALASPIHFLVLGHDPAIRQPALSAGACAFVLIGDPPELLLAALRQVRTALRG
jgi:DNA-binding NarL/FixJ family response regulator